jgi:hypothetical protein
MPRTKDQTLFMKMTSLQHYKAFAIKYVLHVCIYIFSKNWKFMKLNKNPSSNISFCNLYGFQCFHFCNIYTYINMNMCDTYMPPFEQEKMNEKE